MVRRELRHVRALAKKVISRETLKKIRKVDDKKERIDLYKHSIKSTLDLRMHNLEKEMKKVSDKHDIFHLIAKANLLSMKIKYFYITHNKKDLKKALSFLKSIEKELFFISKIKDGRSD